MAKKKKSGSIAVPYLVTMFIGILIIGGGTVMFLRHLGILGGSKVLPEPPQRNVVTSSYADNHTILFILDEENRGTSSSTFMLMRSIPKDKKLVFIGIPTNTIALVGEGQQSISSAYASGGASAAVEFTQQMFGITVDRYMKFDSEGLIKICDILGGVTYPISEDVVGFNGDGTDQYLNSEQVERLITYTMFADGEAERAYIVGSVFSSMVNQASGARIADNLDTSFNTIVNMIDTNVTAVDYRKHKVAIKNMIQNGNSIASFMILSGETAYDEYIPDESFISEFKERYYSYDESSDEETKE